jgi:hypothetical protein
VTIVATILLVTGGLTALVGIGLVLPRQILDVLLGKNTDDPIVLLMGRHWSFLGALVGGLVIYAAFHPEVRVPAMVVGAAEKLAFGVLVIASPLRRRLITMAVVCGDAVMALIYIILLAQGRTS